MDKEFLIGLDRDGTIIEDVGYLGKNEGWREEIKFCDYALSGLKLLKEQSNFKIIIASNQAGVARGYFTFEEMNSINDEINGRLKLEGIELNGSYCCPYVDEKYAKEKGIIQGNKWVIETPFRKPKIGMLELGAEKAGKNLEEFCGIYFIGDKISDVQTGINANGKGILIRNGKNGRDLNDVIEMQREFENRVIIVNNLVHAAEYVIWDSKN